MRERGVSAEVINDILAHAPRAGQARESAVRKAMFACDELCGFLVAVALVSPGKKLSAVTVESVLKKLKNKGFAAAVSREDVQTGADALGFPLPTHVETVLAALQSIADQRGL